MHLSIETELDDDAAGAEVPQPPGGLVYGSTEEEAAAKAESLALRVLAEQLEHGEAKHLHGCHSSFSPCAMSLRMTLGRAAASRSRRATQRQRAGSAGAANAASSATTAR